ncbi:hypothetical protein D3C71_1413550 [compost metagenome]
MHVITAIIRADRLHPVCTIVASGEVFHRVQPAQRIEMGDHFCRGFSFIESGRTLGSDFLEAFGKQRLLDDVAGGRRLSVRQEDGCGMGVARYASLVVSPVHGDTRGDDKTLAGITDGAHEQTLQRQCTVIGMQAAPGGNRAGHGDRMRAGLRNFAGKTEFRQFGYTCCRWCAAGAVQRLDLLSSRRVERKTIATDPRHQRINDALDRNGGDRRIHGIAAILQDFQPGCGRQRVGGGDHGFGGERRRASRGEEIKM